VSSREIAAIYAALAMLAWWNIFPTQPRRWGFDWWLRVTFALLLTATWFGGRFVWQWFG
jgi:hypothetical protein